jgi:recombination DNA repair RAD52 pathway protein
VKDVEPGEAKAATPGHAHEIALKTAETDATKRALATFGNPFGLALYDSEQTGVRQRNTDKTATEVVEVTDGSFAYWNHHWRFHPPGRFLLRAA